jgi:hypothetical protein
MEAAVDGKVGESGGSRRRRRRSGGRATANDEEVRIAERHPWNVSRRGSGEGDGALSWLPSEDAARIGGGVAFGARIRRAPRSGRCHQSRLPSKEGVVARKEGGVVDGVVARFRVGHSMVSGARAGAHRSSGERAWGRGLRSEPWCRLRPLWERGAEDCRVGCTRWRRRGRHLGAWAGIAGRRLRAWCRGGRGGGGRREHRGDGGAGIAGEGAASQGQRRQGQRHGHRGGGDEGTHGCREQRQNRARRGCVDAYTTNISSSRDKCTLLKRIR